MALQSPKESTLFVFYDLSKKAHWTYTRLPKGWRWVGAGFTVPVGAALASAKYPREEQFMGPVESMEGLTSVARPPPTAPHGCPGQNSQRPMRCIYGFNT